MLWDQELLDNSTDFIINNFEFVPIFFILFVTVFDVVDSLNDWDFDILGEGLDKGDFYFIQIYNF